MTTDTDGINALLWECHAEIENAARTALAGVGFSQSPFSISYPPRAALTNDEREALRNPKLGPEQRSGHSKLVIGAASSPIFHALCLIDGISDPMQYPTDEWFDICILAADADDSYRDAPRCILSLVLGLERSSHTNAQQAGLIC